MSKYYDIQGNLMTDSLLHIGAQLKAFRKRKGLNQSEVASQTGIHRQVISDIERGRFTGALSTLMRYLTFANMELTCTPKPDEFPQLDDLDRLFGDEAS